MIDPSKEISGYLSLVIAAGPRWLAKICACSHAKAVEQNLRSIRVPRF